MDPDAAQALCGAGEACAPLIGLSNRACVQLLMPPLSPAEPWIGVIPSFRRTAITANLSSHETCEETRVVLLRNPKEDALNTSSSVVLYQGMGQWDEAQESCVLLSAGADPLPAHRPSLLFHVPDLEPRDALLVSRRGLDHPYTSSMVEQTQIGITHTIVFPAYPAFGCCAGYDLQVPQTASICGLPSAEAVFSRHIGTPSLDTPERSEYVVPAVPCVMEGFVYTLDKTAPAPTPPGSSPRPRSPS